ncbi:cupin-domain containing protein [Klebsormidium nitens]|uniref:Cupin-domain containing protein n=1 Tax=Klebsormidium nitens TaxID=105231 RepID=A0A1Y1IFL5_KLENI|nr:cupin-domain containing protein [Klebsormidium nitens]|eukprot:GAQ87527.1 cupin-domain containing protein [Klebsormidium nitens]
MAAAGGGRSVQRIITSIKTTEGGGFKINRPFPTRALDQFDPWLMLDEMGPIEYGPGEALGAPDHPHRGFETITYLLDGASTHKDSAGLTGSMKAGDVQWMTAGSGVVHCEMPSEDILKEGGRVHGFQIWLNLPKRDKWIQPRYQDTRSEDIPVVETAEKSVWVKVIAGESMGTKAVIETRTPILFLHCKLQPGASFTQEVPSSYNAFAYLIEGEGVFGNGKHATAKQAVFFERDGDSVTVKNDETAKETLSLLLLAGTPLNEPIARYGPFVMNTQEEIQQAFTDFRAGRMGKIKHPEAAR